jgi:hypothetical protein
VNLCFEHLAKLARVSFEERAQTVDNYEVLLKFYEDRLSQATSQYGSTPSALYQRMKDPMQLPASESDLYFRALRLLQRCFQ